MEETIYVILKLLFDFSLEVWFSIVLEKDCFRSLLFSNGQVPIQINKWIELNHYIT